MLRYSFVNLLHKIDNIEVYNLYKINWNEFVFKSGYKVYKLKEEDCYKFYNVVLKEYNNILMEDIIYYINRIDDPFSLRIGQEIYLPKYEDIDEFIQSQIGVQT